MFEFERGKKVETKCYVTHGTMGHLDPENHPTKRKPFVNVRAVTFVHKVELVLPKELYLIIKDELMAKINSPVYSRVILPLSALLEGDFFNEYIKKGDVLMLSEGTHGLDNVFYLKDGILTLTLDKESYERAGLLGKPDGVKGNRDTKPRWIVEINLRLPSMLHGKKGFDRIVYACKNVLTRPVTWLFVDLKSKEPLLEPMAQHFPTSLECLPEFWTSPKVIVPSLHPPMETDDTYDGDFSDFTTDLYEWLSMISLESPRLDVADQIDPFLSRYSVPPPEIANVEAVELTKIMWEGFISSSWAHRTLVQTLLVAKATAWFSFSVFGFEGSLAIKSRDCTVLKLPGASSEYLLWEVGRS